MITTNMMIEFKVIAAHQLSPDFRHQIAVLSEQAFDEDPWSQYAFMVNARHIVGLIDHQVVSHALWTERLFQIENSDLLKTAYVEYVATQESWKNRGLASQLLAYLIEYIQLESYKLAALCPEHSAFYQRLGWTLWQGRLAIRTGSGLVLTPDDQIMLYALDDILTEKYDMSVDKPLLSAEWREGELW